MFARENQHTAEINKRFTVEPQRGNSSTADRCCAEDLRPIVCPGKMASPEVAARIEESDDFAGDRIGCVSTIVFMIIAALAGKRQVFGGLSSATTARLDVL